ncbi:MAG: phage tail sheath subtilisin-like domain-containing protein [Nitrospira sp.]|nr:phage tail sheath subtilisin-like domain-containing protein [Nitrospira sp.]
MPEYLAPGVYVEETSFRAKSIEGVGTSTTGLVGPTRKGPVGGTPELLTSFSDFERIYGGLDNLEYGTNFLAHSVRAYFDNGGSRLYVARVTNSGGGTAVSPDIVTNADSTLAARFITRFPGQAGNGQVMVQLKTAPATKRTMNVAPLGSMIRSGEGEGMVFHVKQEGTWVDSSDTALDLSSLADTDVPNGTADFLSLSIVAIDRDGHVTGFDDLGLDRSHPRWLGNVLSDSPSRRRDALEQWLAAEIGSAVTAFQLREGFFASADEWSQTLTGGSDGSEPDQAAYETALKEFEKLEDISIVAAPGSSSYADAQGILGALISHAERIRYRIAVVDTPQDKAVSEAREIRGRVDSKYAALYYPWVVVSNPLSRAGDASVPREIALPPSGFVCGIYARNDVERGVHKAPANEVVRGALRFERDVNFAEQEVLNPLGVNCLRYLSGRGYRVWGARTVSSDPEWKYVNVRRYMNYLEASIDRGTQWAVFEPNGERLWANIRETVSAFLYNEWVNGALLGSSGKEAFFVRCDRSTMTQNDLDNGRLICLVGVAVLKPAEFVIFRIGQKTADERQ